MICRVAAAIVTVFARLSKNMEIIDWAGERREMVQEIMTESRHLQLLASERAEYPGEHTYAAQWNLTKERLQVALEEFTEFHGLICACASGLASYRPWSHRVGAQLTDEEAYRWKPLQDQIEGVGSGAVNLSFFRPGPPSMVQYATRGLWDAGS